jgi:hypothetical protein
MIIFKVSEDFINVGWLRMTPHLPAVLDLVAAPHYPAVPHHSLPFSSLFFPAFLFFIPLIIL